MWGITQTQNNYECKHYLGENEDSKTHAWLPHIKTHGTNSEKVCQPAPAQFSRANVHTPRVIAAIQNLGMVTYEATSERSDCSG